MEIFGFVIPKAFIALLVILIGAAYVSDIGNVQEETTMWWEGSHWWQHTATQPPVNLTEPQTGISQAEAQRNLHGTVSWNDAGKFWQNESKGYGANGLFDLKTAGDTPGADKPKEETSTYAAKKKAALSEMTTFTVREISDWERKGIPYKLQVKLDGKTIDPRVFTREGRSTESRRKVDDTAYENYHQAAVDESSEVSNDKFVWTSMTGLDSQVKALRFYFDDATNSNKNAELVLTVDPDRNDGVRLIEQNNDNLKDVIPWKDVVIVQATEAAYQSAPAKDQVSTSGDTNQQGETDTGSKNPPAYTPTGWP